MSETNKLKTKYFYALGRRKTSIATLRLYPGKGENLINNKQLKSVYPLLNDQQIILAPLRAVEKLDKYFFTVNLKGGGNKSQRGAIVNALARALVISDKEFKPKIKKYGYLTRDSRMVERKHTGHKKSRKSEQYSKR